MDLEFSTLRSELAPLHFVPGTTESDNDALEGFNSLIHAAKARARGYRTNRNLITMAYLIAGQLKFNLPT